MFYRQKFDTFIRTYGNVEAGNLVGYITNKSDFGDRLTNGSGDEYECGTATISRDIEFMRDRLLAPIEYDAVHRGFYYSEPEFKLPSAFSTPESLAAIGIVHNLLAVFQGTPLYDTASALLDTLEGGQQVWHFSIGFTGESEAWVQDRVWAKDQKFKHPMMTTYSYEGGKMTKKEKTGIVIEFTSTQFEKVLEWTLSRGEDAHVFEPKELKTAFYDNAVKMYAHAKIWGRIYFMPQERHLCMAISF
jgi:predicted DNA-binding transcriptional regulator YafY